MSASSRTRLITTRAGTLVAVMFALSVVTAAPAQAEELPPVRIVFEPAETKLEYRDGWELKVTTYDTLCGRPNTCRSGLEITATGDNGFRKKINIGVPYNGRVYINSRQFSENPMPAGTYSVTAQFKDPRPTPLAGVNSSANKAARIVIAPAKIAVDFRIETDAHQPRGAIASAQLTGAFIQSINECYSYGGCDVRVPDGEWSFTINDEAGGIVAEKQIPVKGGSTQFASFYWHDVPLASDFTASATFTPASAQAKNFAIEQETQLLFTSPAEPAVGESDPAVVAPVPEAQEAPSSVPLWLAILGLGIIALLLVTIVVFLVLMARLRVRSSDVAAATVIDGDGA